MTVPYQPEEYLELVAQIEKRYFNDCVKYNKRIANKNNDTAWYGYNQHNPRKALLNFGKQKSASISLMINVDENVIAHLKNNNSNKNQDIFAGGRTLQRYEQKALRGEIVDVKDSIDNIINIYTEEGPSKPQNILKTIPNRSGYHFYLGAYYSIRDYGVKTFLLLFSKNKDKDGLYKTYEIGFHNVRGGEQGKKNLLYQGIAYYENSYIFANLTRKNSKHQLNIICNTFTNEQTAMNHNITCSLQGVSLYGGVVSAECYLIKLKENFLSIFLNADLFEIPKVENILGVYDSVTLSLYLWLHKSTFLVGHKKSYEVPKLVARGIEVKKFKELEGTYIIWQYGLKKFTIVQSKFVINGDGTGWLFPPVELDRNKDILKDRMKVLEKQPCSINLSLNTRKKPMAIIETHFEKLNIFNTAMFSCNPAMNGDVTIGAFSTIGYYEERSVPSLAKRNNQSFSDVVTGYFAMQKYEAPFEPEVLSFDKAETVANKGMLNSLLRELLDVWLSKSWELTTDEKRKIIEVRKKLVK